MGLFGSSKKKMAREQQAHELRLQREQQEWNLQMWNMQNEYNAPSAQLDRLLEAGINPNALYGTSSVAGNADSVQPYERAHAILEPSTGEAVTDAMAPIYNMMDAFQRLEMNSATIKNLNQQTEKTKTDVALGKQQVSYNDLTFNARVESAVNAPKELQARIDKLISDTKIQKDTFEIFARKNEEELKQIVQVTNNLRVDYLAKLKDIEKTQSEINLLDEQERSQRQQRLLDSYKLEYARAYGFAPGTPVADVMFDLWQKGEDSKMVDYYLSACASDSNYAKEAGAIAFGATRGINSENDSRSHNISLYRDRIEYLQDDYELEDDEHRKSLIKRKIDRYQKRLDKFLQEEEEYKKQEERYKETEFIQQRDGID